MLPRPGERVSGARMKCHKGLHELTLDSRSLLYSCKYCREEYVRKYQDANKAAISQKNKEKIIRRRARVAEYLKKKEGAW
jgi:hypothetical protein